MARGVGVEARRRLRKGELLEPNARRIVPRRHVGDDDAVADGQTVDDFDRVHRSAAELYVRAAGVAGALLDLEEPNRTLSLAVGRPTDVQHILEPVDLDGAVDAEIGP